VIYYLSHMKPLSNYLITVDETGAALGVEENGACHQGEGILHSAFLVMIFDHKNRLMQAKRSRHKKLWPHFWDGTVAGHFYPEESREASLKKRVFEETGLACVAPKFLFGFFYQARYKNIGIEKEICHVFAADHVRTEGISLNPNEVSECRFFEIAELERKIEAEALAFTPWFLMAFRRGRDNGVF